MWLWIIYCVGDVNVVNGISWVMFCVGVCCCRCGMLVGCDLCVG